MKWEEGIVVAADAFAYSKHDQTLAPVIREFEACARLETTHGYLTPESRL